LLRKRRIVKILPHAEAGDLQNLDVPVYKKIAISLDFTENDPKLLAHAIGQGNAETTYCLIHVVESVPARVYENESDDMETGKDNEHLLNYIDQLKQKGLEAEARLGFGPRAKEIARLVKESNADMLVIGAHGHTGLKDFIYGETVNAVRHELKVPVLVVHL
jgi:manganese transport protein